MSFDLSLVGTCAWCVHLPTVSVTFSHGAVTTTVDLCQCCYDDEFLDGQRLDVEHIPNATLDPSCQSS